MAEKKRNAGTLRQHRLRGSIWLAQLMLNIGWLRLERADGSGKAAEKARRAVERSKALGRAVVSGQTAGEYAAEKLMAAPRSFKIRLASVAAGLCIIIAALCSVGRISAYAAIPRAGGRTVSAKFTDVPLAEYAASQQLLGVEVSGDPVKIRPQPGAEYDSIGEAYSSDGKIYKYLGEDTDTEGVVWFHIQYTAETDGWVSSGFSRKVYAVPEPAPDGAAMISEIAEKYDAVGVQAAVVADGRVAACYNWGWAEIGSAPMTSDTAVRVGGLSKIALAMCAVNMQEQGIVNLNTDISRYWNVDVRNPVFETPVTLRSLLCETSSMVYHDYADYTLADTAAELRRPSCFDRKKEPGRAESWNVCNFASGVAGSTLELAGNFSLFEYSENELFSAAGINRDGEVNASFASGRVTGSVAALYDSGHNTSRGISDQLARRGSSVPGESISYWAGGLTISARDMASLMAVLAADGELNGVQVMSPESVSLMETFIFPAKEYGVEFWQCLPMRYINDMYDGRGLYYQTGNAYGVLAAATYDPVNRSGVVVISIGAQELRDRYGVYKICGEICELLYGTM